MTIERANRRSVRHPSGTVPDVSGALLDWFQPMQFENVTKGTIGFQVIETGIVTKFRGVIMPFTNQQLMIKPWGERKWKWFQLFSERVLDLDMDDVLTYLGTATRVMARKDFRDYGYLYYELVQDWTGSSPQT